MFFVLQVTRTQANTEFFLCIIGFITGTVKFYCIIGNVLYWWHVGNLRAPPETVYTIVEKCLECGLGHNYAEVVGLYGRDSLKVADKLSSEIRHNGECGYVVYGVAYRKYKSVDG